MMLVSVSAGVSLPNRPQIDPLAAELAATLLTGLDSGGALLARPSLGLWRGTRGTIGEGRRS